MFSLPLGDSVVIELNYTYSISMVALSLLMGILGSFTALCCNARMNENSFISKRIWLLFASLAMGLGIWGLHFIGIGAILFPVPMTQNFALTIVSIIPAFIASLLAFYFVNQPRKSPKLYVLAAVLMGIGISTMHYVGMFALIFQNISHYYDPFWFIISIVVATLVSYVALYILSNTKVYMSKAVSTALLLGLAIAAMHYSGMGAMKFYATSEDFMLHGTNPVYMMDTGVLSATISVSTIIVTSILLLALVGDRYIEKRVNYFDPLTKQQNRRMFLQELEKDSKGMAVAIWHFHDLDSYTHEYGYLFLEQLIRSISKYLHEYTPPLTDVYRLSGNRFVFVARDKAASEELEGNLAQLSEIFKQGIIFEDKEILLQGVCAFVPRTRPTSLKEMHLNALSILNHASIDYRLNITYYNPDFHTRNFAEEILEDFEHAKRSNELFVVYQPKVDTRTNTVSSVEALIRWQHTKYGVLSPGVFIPILEENNKMGDLTDWVIEQACITLNHWRKNDIMIHQIAINIPGPYLTSLRLMKVLKEMTARYRIEPASLELEITETSFVKTVESAEKAVRQFRAEGFSVALDDFGTGASSLSYLKKISITTLKIDKSFVDDVPGSLKDASIIQSIIQLGQSLNIAVVVEGVETQEQVEFLLASCNYPQIQGYYFAKPMQLEDLESWCQAFHMQMKV